MRIINTLHPLLFNQLKRNEMETLESIIIELWHISRTALATQDTSRHSRMQYIMNELKRTYPKYIEGMSVKQIWFAIEDQIY